MIKIDNSLFDKNELLKIYGEDSKEIETIRQSIIKKVNENDPIVIALFHNWFYENGQVSKSRISSFLMDPEPARYIVEFAEVICETIWNDKELANSYLMWEEASKRAAKASDIQERIKILSPLVYDKSAIMFSMQGKTILAEDLDQTKKQGTLFSNKQRINYLRITETAKIDTVLDACRKVFDYEKFALKHRAKVLSAMHVSVCPYCNRQYITPYRKNGKQYTSAAIDHYFSKNRYPFLALSLYNIVPSCSICNSSLKGTSDFFQTPHINPHKRGFDDSARFRIKNVEALVARDEKPAVYLEHTDNEEVRNSIDTFCLETIYDSAHEDYIEELIRKAKIYSDKKMQEYLELFKELFADKEEMRQILYGNYLRKKDLGKRPLSKLTRDILMDLGICLD